MRVKMRSSLYSSDPEMTSKLKSFSGEELDGKLLDITSFGIETKKQNILKKMNTNDFFTSLSSQKIDVFKTETKTNLKIDEQIRILLSCVNDPRMRADLYNYWQEVQKDKEYREEEFFNNLLNDRLFFDELICIKTKFVFVKMIIQSHISL